MFHVGIDIKPNLRIQPKLPWNSRNFIEKFFGNTCPKRNQPAKYPTGCPEPQIANIGIIQPAGEFHPSFARCRFLHIEPTGLVQAYLCQFGRDYYREPILRPHDVSLDTARKTPCMSLIDGHALPKSCFNLK